MSVLIINGSIDPLMPYDGRDVVITLSPKKKQKGKAKTRGRVLSIDRTVELWLALNGLTSVHPVEITIDKGARDGL